jgi:EAL domain-containing protein (putative c-di-GMP-specific phosphodiesterase class I)
MQSGRTTYSDLDVLAVRQALDDPERTSVVYMPKVAIGVDGSRTVVGAEALLRLQGDHARVRPDIAGEIAHDIGRGAVFDAMAVKKAIQGVPALKRLLGRDFELAVNLSYRSLLSSAVREVMTSRPPDLRLKIEVLEVGYPERPDGQRDTQLFGASIARAQVEYAADVELDDIDSIPNGLALPRVLQLLDSGLHGVKISNRAIAGARRRPFSTDEATTVRYQREAEMAERWMRDVRRLKARSQEPGFSVTVEGVEYDETVEMLRGLTVQGWAFPAIVGPLGIHHAAVRERLGTEAFVRQLSIAPQYLFVDDIPELAQAVQSYRNESELASSGGRSLGLSGVDLVS